MTGLKYLFKEKFGKFIKKLVASAKWMHLHQAAFLLIQLNISLNQQNSFEWT